MRIETTSETRPRAAGLERIAGGLALAATPTFAVLAALTSLDEGSVLGMLCGQGAASPLSGMTAMYLLMSAFHAAPWLRLVAGRNRRP